MTTSRFPLVCCALLVLLAGGSVSLHGHGYPDGTFEGRHTHSIALTPDGSRLLALNTPDGRLSVFAVTDVTNPVPVLVSEIPVGLEPVSVRVRTNDEVWVVNEVSDSVSIVSLSLGAVVATLQVSDEPADVVFAQGKAFVSCARNNLLRVFDATTRAPLPSIPLQGLYPRALAVDASGAKIFVAFLYSGNGTTILPAAQAPAPPLPTNPALLPAPQTGLIVPATHPDIHYTVLDHDIAEVDVATGAVARYLGGVGTNLFDIAIQPGSGRPWIANSEARNLVRFEPVLRGHVADFRLTRLDAVTGAPTIFDLNPGIDYGILPNPAARQIALSQPTAITFTSDGATAWVAAFGSDRVARVSSASGSILDRVDLRTASTVTGPVRGPRSLALLENRQRLFVLNKVSNTVTVINTASGSVVAEVPCGSHDPTFPAIRAGRGFLFDARLSGNGTISCATCHLDADVDGLAWDLGDPAGDVVTVEGANLSAHDPTPRPRVMHPMKGPMVTQTLRALVEGAPFHWRGDRPQLESFNVTFDKLMGGSELPATDIAKLAAYITTIAPHPNPHRNLDDTLPATFAGGNPQRGAEVFDLHTNHCVACHEEESGGVNNIDLFSAIGGTQPIKNPSLRSVYQRRFFDPRPGATSLSGFGLSHDGTGFALPTVHPYALDQLGQESFEDFADVSAFILCFDPDIPPSMGRTRTFNAQNVNEAAALGEIAVLETESVAFRLEIAVQGVIAGRRRVFFHDSSTGLYRQEKASAPAISRGDLLAMLAGGDTLSFLAVPFGRGSRLGGDFDTDAVLDGDEPMPTLTATRVGPNARLEWPADPAGWVLESATDLDGPWTAVTRARSASGANLLLDDPLAGATTRFYRLRRTW